MENSFSTSNPQEDLLSDDLMVNLQQASVGKRFANYLIDLVLFIIVGIFIFAFFIRMGVLALDMNPFLDRLLSLLLYAILMGTTEAIFKGKTLGKAITRTRAVNDDGTPISARTAFLRGFSRAVPFEPLSGFSGYPWHDSWTHTYVIDEQKSTLPKQ